jgi:hypothetical protein
MVLSVFLCEPVDAKKKRKRFISPVKIEKITTSPDPFIIGQGPLTLSMMVKLPMSVKSTSVLEVSALITSPTRRSMSFVSRRLLFAEATQGGRLGLVPVELVWDGKDQYDHFVSDGSYFYEIQAKLLEDTGNGPRTKIVSRKIQGTLEALAYVGEVLPPLPPEPEVSEEIEILQQEELVADTIPMMEEELKAEGKAPVHTEELVGEEDGEVPEFSGENEFGQDPLSENKDLVLEIQSEMLLEELDPTAPPSLESESGLPNTGQVPTPTLDQPLTQVPTGAAMSSEASSSPD